jgi:WD40 repeat protein
MPFPGASEWHCSVCAAVNSSERQNCFACGQARRADGEQRAEKEPRMDASLYQEHLLAQRLDKRNVSRRRFLLAGLTAGAALALGAGVFLFRPPWVRELDMDSAVTAVSWSPDSSAFAAGSSHVTIWRACDGQELTSLPIMRYAKVFSVAWSPTSRYFAVAWSGAGAIGGFVSIWKTPTQESASSWKHERDIPIGGGFDVSPLVVAWSPDGTRLAVGDSGGGLQIWNPSSGQVLHVLQPSQAIAEAWIPVSSLAWSPDGTHIAAVNVAAGTTYAVWNATTGKVMPLPSQCGIFIFPGQWYLNITVLGWSPDGTTIAGSGCETVLIWRWNKESGSWKKVHSLPVTPSLGIPAITALTWAPDSQRFATADRNNKILIWHASTGQQLGSYTLNPPQVGGDSQGYMDTDFEIYTLAWSPDGKYLLSGDYAGRVLLWAVR